MRFFVGEKFVPQGRVRMDPSTVGFWALSLVGIAALVCAQERLEPCMTFGSMIDRGFHLSQGAEGAL